MVQQLRNFVVEWQRRLGHDDKQHQASGGESDFHKTSLITGWLEPLGDDDDDRNVMMRRNLVHDLRLRVGQNASLWGAVTPGHNSNLIIGIAFVILAFLLMLIPIMFPDTKYKSLYKIVQCAHYVLDGWRELFKTALSKIIFLFWYVIVIVIFLKRKARYSIIPGLSACLLSWHAIAWICHHYCNLLSVSELFFLLLKVLMYTSLIMYNLDIYFSV